MTPLTPTERAALEAAKAELREARDAWNLDQVDHNDRMKVSLGSWYSWAQDNDIPESAKVYAEEMRARHLAATILARQVAERLTIG